MSNFSTLKVISSSIALVLLSACATNYGSSQVQNFGAYSNLEKGETTKQEVFEIFGQPHDVNYFETGESLWTYFSVEMTMSGATLIPFIGLVAGGNNMDTTTANFFFNPQEVFSKVDTSSKSQYVNQWVGIATIAMENDEMTRVEEEMEKLDLPFDPKIARSMKGTSELTQ